MVPNSLHMLLENYHQRSECLKSREITIEDEKRWVNQEEHDLITRAADSPANTLLSESFLVARQLLHQIVFLCWQIKHARASNLYR